MNAKNNRKTGGRASHPRSVSGGLLNRWVRIARSPLADRNSKVTRIRAAIQAGSYDAESMIDAAITRLSRELSFH